jgi:hypothetical protein
MKEEKKAAHFVKARVYGRIDEYYLELNRDLNLSRGTLLSTFPQSTGIGYYYMLVYFKFIKIRQERVETHA